MKLIMNAQEIDQTITRVATQVIESHKNMEHTYVIGLRTRGEFIAQRLVKKIQQFSGKEVPFGVMDATLYRDDLSMAQSAPILKGPVSTLDFDDKKVLIVDDVMFTARTARSALYCVMDHGRPALVEFFVLIDRGHNELPLYARYKGKEIPTFRSERVKVCLQEIDDEDAIYITQAQ
ncbi:bifunctional pyr operon transcriptional regulator/uracil phosphoribosyltransferase PyrR [Desulfurispira natronophila]|uniref:Bifunctional protein PyrR n=1 Tax=Desulfurispira natronophila TaxID=682562 RepID=A0A7W7Y288_9BACT|nr:bifunctional pyr operon transcriptional regulator/uracil phosphoribosyltransferase PyrR [Desulfurispira natronophila]MBB5020736.1 pyrimidine operon attenuation protein/uracil phosphoribosyltransferase [Desulfurispira natronophila]